MDTLAYLFEVHGEPEFIRSDNGPEFVSEAVRSWLKTSGTCQRQWDTLGD